MFLHIPHNEIDKQKWDANIENASNGMPIAYSWYLDIVSPNWDALIAGDYELIFPLTWRKKFGIKYLYQPFFTSCFAVYGQAIESMHTNEALEIMQSMFRYIDINVLVDKQHIPISFKITEKRAQQIDMKKEYQPKSHSLNQNLRIANKSGILKYESIEPGLFVKLAENELAGKIREFGKPEYAMLLKLIEISKEKGKGIAIGIPDGSTGYFAGCFLMKSPKNIVLIKAFTTQEGRKNGSMSFLRKAFLESISGQDIKFAFGGSNISGIAAFNKSFGGKDYAYYHLKLNNLPMPLRFIKK